MFDLLGRTFSFTRRYGSGADADAVGDADAGAVRVIKMAAVLIVRAAFLAHLGQPFCIVLRIQGGKAKYAAQIGKM